MGEFQIALGDYAFSAFPPPLPLFLYRTSPASCRLHRDKKLGEGREGGEDPYTVKSREIRLAWQCGSAIQNTTKMVIDRHIGGVLYGEFCQDPLPSQPNFSRFYGTLARFDSLMHSKVNTTSVSIISHPKRWLASQLLGGVRGGE